MVEWALPNTINYTGGFTVDTQDYTITEPKRKRGQHLRLEDRGAMHVLFKEKYTDRAIARIIGCSPSTVGNERARGTPARKSNRGRAPQYNPRVAQQVYRENRIRSRRKHKLESCGLFTTWALEQIKEYGWSLDACVGYARRNKLFHESQIPSTSTLYNAVWAGRFALKPIDLPEATKRRHHKRKSRVNKRPKGTSIEHRPAVVDERKEMGHWETDTVVGKREGKEAVVLSLVERVSMNYLSILIPGKTSDAVMGGMKLLRETFGDKFGTVFKTITTDNGPEFETFSQVEDWGTKIYFAHPYSSWERPVNERHNRILRIYMPKGKSMAHCTPEDVLAYSDEMNGLPRRCLDYRTPEEVFEEFLDTVYAA